MKWIEKITGYAFTPASEHNKVVEILQWILRNAIVTAGPGMEVRSLPQGRGLGLASSSQPESTEFVGKITSSWALNYKKWRYTIVEVEKTGLGYGGWTVKSGGRTGNAYNTIEDMNSVLGMMGNGINPMTLPSTFTIKPAPDNCIVRLWEEKVQGQTEWWFSYENAVDGSCPT